MEIYNNQSYKRNNHPLINLNLTVFSTIIFIFVISSMKSFFIPNFLGWILFFISVSILFINNFVLQKKGITITEVDIMWVFFLFYFIFNIMIHNLFEKSIIIDLFHYTIGILLMLVLKTNINDYNFPFKLINLFGIIYALSAIFQYIFTDIYLATIFPLFSEGEQFEILKLLNENSYTGFTNQTAYIAGYIVSAIGVIIFVNRKDEQPVKFILYVTLIILIIGLFLAAKRAHFLFMIIALVITIIFSSNKKFHHNKFNRLIIGSFILTVSLITLYNFVNFNDDSPIGNFIEELKRTFIGILSGEDVTTGRTKLYNYAWELFTQNPIVGIGWKEYIVNSIGLLNVFRGSHPHNIYLQLLSEMGIIGLILFIIPVLYVYIYTFRMLRIVSDNNSMLKIQKWKSGVQYAFFYQTFFLLYGLTGNLLTDFNFLLMYFFVVTISLSAKVKLNFTDVNENF